MIYYLFYISNADIISQLGYDKFGQREYLRYETYYKYETDRRRLENMTAKSNMTYGSSVNRTFINNNYSYDILSNVLSVENTAALPTKRLESLEFYLYKSGRRRLSKSECQEFHWN